MTASLGTCARCGRHGDGRTKVMVYRVLEKFPDPPVAQQFFCNRWLRVMRVYATIGFTLLAVLLVSLVGVALWIRSGA